MSEAPDPTLERAAHLERARLHVADKAWESAYLELSVADELGPLGLEELGWMVPAAGLTGRDPELIKTLERLYQLHLERGECLTAARAAFWLTSRLAALGEGVRASGWAARVQRLVERESTPCVEAGYLLLLNGSRALAMGQSELALEAATKAAETGSKFSDSDLMAIAQNLQGRAMLRVGRVAEGLVLLDESMLGVTCGELSPICVGLMYCWTISGCQRVYALDRAREWTRALSDWCAAQPELVTFTGTCMVHRSEIFQLGGQWERALLEARRVEERKHEREPEGVRGDAAYQQAEIHRLRGELTLAEEAYRRAAGLGREPQPGLALLWLAQGRAEAAENALRRLQSTLTDALRRARFLPAYVEVLLSNEKQDEAEVACTELERIAASLGTTVAAALAGQARGALHLARSEAELAIEPLRRAFKHWQELGAPYLAARVRVLLARACSHLGDVDSAELELRVARDGFEQLGAKLDLQQLVAPTRSPSGAPQGLTARELEVLRLVAAGKTNKLIAAALHLSEKTVDRHVSNIFAKLDVSTRAAATAFVYEHGLL